MTSRRQFLRRSALIALCPMAPAFLDVMARAAGAATDSRILVVIQMEGGNDGINTVVPFGDDAYFRNRVELRIDPKQVLKLNDHVGLHPSMRGIAAQIDQGRLAIVQGVGYPNPSRSHFQSMATWQTARPTPSADERGWIGRAFDTLPLPRAGGPDAIYVGPSELPRSLIGRRIDAASISSAADLNLKVPIKSTGSAGGGDDVRQFVQKRVLSAYGTASDLASDKSPGSMPTVTYPPSDLARQLQLVSQFIKSDAATRIYVASQSGYDTHQLQMSQHETLLSELSSSIAAFMADLRAAKLSDRVLLMAFSEFGRRVKENDSLGTDHGTAAPVLLAGDAVRTGLIGKTPSLSDLIDGDLKMSVDFRQIYATILNRWLNVPSKEVLAGGFEPLDVLKNS